MREYYLHTSDLAKQIYYVSRIPLAGKRSLMINLTKSIFQQHDDKLGRYKIN